MNTKIATVDLQSGIKEMHNDLTGNNMDSYNLTEEEMLIAKLKGQTYQQARTIKLVQRVKEQSDTIRRLTDNK
jgi:hypothetical protein